MSDRDSWTDPQPDAPTPLKKQGMSGCLLASLIVGGLGVVGMLMCCGFIGWAFMTFMPKPTIVPAEVTQIATGILDTKLLEDFVPVEAASGDNMLFMLRTAEFKHKDGKGGLVMGKVKFKFGDPAQGTSPSQDFRTKIELKMRGSLDVKKSESHDVLMGGHKVSVLISDATDRDTRQEVHVASGDFELPSGTTFFLLRLDDDIWDQDAVLKLLEESRLPDAEK
jgi:hypothetical protein